MNYLCSEEHKRQIDEALDNANREMVLSRDYPEGIRAALLILVARVTAINKCLETRGVHYQCQCHLEADTPAQSLWGDKHAPHSDVPDDVARSVLAEMYGVKP